MPDYINRKSLVENLNRFAPEAYSRSVDLIISKQPTADVVEVVRCRDCKYKDECIRRIEFMGRNPVIELNTYEYHPLEFCSYGQRKEANHADTP